MRSIFSSSVENASFLSHYASVVDHYKGGAVGKQGILVADGAVKTNTVEGLPKKKWMDDDE